MVTPVITQSCEREAITGNDTVCGGSSNRRQSQNKTYLYYRRGGKTQKTISKSLQLFALMHRKKEWRRSGVDNVSGEFESFCLSLWKDENRRTLSYLTFTYTALYNCKLKAVVSCLFAPNAARKTGNVQSFSNVKHIHIFHFVTQSRLHRLCSVPLCPLCVLLGFKVSESQGDKHL